MTDDIAYHGGGYSSRTAENTVMAIEGAVRLNAEIDTTLYDEQRAMLQQEYQGSTSTLDLLYNTKGRVELNKVYGGEIVFTIKDSASDPNMVVPSSDFRLNAKGSVGLRGNLRVPGSTLLNYVPKSSVEDGRGLSILGIAEAEGTGEFNIITRGIQKMKLKSVKGIRAGRNIIAYMPTEADLQNYRLLEDSQRSGNRQAPIAHEGRITMFVKEHDPTQHDYISRSHFKKVLDNVIRILGETGLSHGTHGSGHYYILGDEDKLNLAVSWLKENSPLLYQIVVLLLKLNKKDADSPGLIIQHVLDFYNYPERQKDLQEMMRLLSYRRAEEDQFIIGKQIVGGQPGQYSMVQIHR